MPTWAWWTPRPGPPRVRQAGGRECPSQCPAEALGLGRNPLNTAMHGSPPQTLSRVPCDLVGRRAKPRTGAPTPGPDGAPEPTLTGEAFLGPVDSQSWAPQGTAGWRKGVLTPRPSGGPAGAPEPKLEGEASPGLVDSQAWAPRATAGWRKGVSGPAGVWSELSEHSHIWESSPDPVPEPCHLVGQRTKAMTEALTPGPARAPGPKQTGEASLGPVDSQAWAPQGTAGWRKGALAPGADGSPAGAPDPKLAGEASLVPVDSQAWTLRVWQAGGREHPARAL
ncbi:hypothetical protein NDU88_000311 [Pleurodeles waltl]|uniref:Uncharacterized protein n=1 Tax=Pleurodeles waltl TaxID=8319 RepID=A0AAV7V805_PLEWA|nr:hypothetical protein NDU88_000311 [Pleurodeles waltl]